MSLRPFLILMIFFSLMGCNTVAVKVPAAEVSSPAISESSKLNLALSYQPATEVKMSGVNDRPPTFTQEMTSSSATGGELKYGLVRGLELGAGVLWPSGEGIADIGFAVKGKIQLIGPHSLVSNSGTVPLMLSVFGNYKSLSGSSSGDQKYTGGAGGYGWRAKLVSSTADYGASMGYLISSGFMPYVGYAQGRGNVKLTLTQDANTTDQPDPGGSWEKSYDVETKTSAAGFSFIGERYSLDIQYQWQDGMIADKSLKEDKAAVVLNINPK